MKKTYIYLTMLALIFGVRVHAADDITQVLDEVEQIQNVIEEKTPEQLSGVVGKIEAWRIVKANEFVVLRDQKDIELNGTEEEGTVTLNEEGNIEIETGIGEAKENPQLAAAFYLFVILAFVFSLPYLFYAIFILIVLTVLKMILGRLFSRGE